MLFWGRGDPLLPSKRSGFLYLISTSWVWMRPTGPAPISGRDLTTPTRGLERTHSRIKIRSRRSQPQCLLYPNELTSSTRAATSEKCPNPDSKKYLLDHLVGKRKQCRRNNKAEPSSGLLVDH